MLRLGSERDVLVAVQADSDASLADLRTLLADWTDDDSAQQLVDTNPAFKVHLSPAPHGVRGARTVPHLRHGGDVLARSDDPVDVLFALGSVLGGIHTRRPGDGRSWANLRVFARGDRAVLGYVARPHLVADRALKAEGVAERVNWGVELLGDGRVSVPDHLDLRWHAIDAEVPTGSAALEIAGLVLLDAMSSTPAAHLASLATSSTSTHWFATVSNLLDRGHVHVVTDRPAAVRAVLGELT